MTEYSQLHEGDCESSPINCTKENLESPVGESLTNSVQELLFSRYSREHMQPIILVSALAVLCCEGILVDPHIRGVGSSTRAFPSGGFIPGIGVAHTSKKRQRGAAASRRPRAAQGPTPAVTATSGTFVLARNCGVWFSGKRGCGGFGIQDVSGEECADLKRCRTANFSPVFATRVTAAKSCSHPSAPIRGRLTVVLLTIDTSNVAVATGLGQHL